MILPGHKSPIKIGKAFSIKGEIVTRNTFFPVGKSGKGLYHVILIFGKTVDWKNLKLHESKIEHSSECTQYFICGIEESIIGSLFEVAYRKVDLTSNRMTLVRHQSVDTFQCSSDQSVGGVVLYKDSYDNTVVIPSSVHPNSFLVSI